MFWQNLRFAWRSLRSNPGFATAAILALAVGIGLNTAMFSVVDGILLKPLNFSKPDDLFVLREQVIRTGPPSLYFLTASNFLDYRATAKSADIGAYALSPFSLVIPNADPERYPGVMVSEGWFRLLGAKFLRGRDFGAEDHQLGRDIGVIISAGLWRERFAADEMIVGREVNLNGRPRKIVGVVDSAFDFPAKNKIWAPLTFSPEQINRRSFHFLMSQGRLRPGYTMGQAKSEFGGILANLARQYPEFNSKKAIYLEPLAEEMTGKVKPALVALIGAVAFVLAIACANVANLILARGAVRKSELAVRASLGATRSNLILQLLTESLLLSALGGLLGLIFAGLAFFAFKLYAPQNLPRIDQVAIDLRVIGYNLLAVVLTGTLFGLVPALRLSKVDLHTSLKDRTRGGSARTQFRNLLVIGQVSAALMLMTGAGLLIRSLYQLTEVDLGFKPDHLVQMRVTPLPAKYDQETVKQVQFAQSIVRNVSTIPGLKSVAITTSLPFQGNPRYAMSVEGGPPATAATAPVTDYFAVTPGYFETMQIPLLEGRAFNANDKLDAPQVVIVNQTFVKTHFPDGRAVGKRMEIGLSNPPEWREIVGVAKDVKNLGIDQAVRVQVYAPYYHSPSIIQTQATSFSVVARTEGDPALLAQAVRQKILEADNSQPVWQIQTMETTINDSLARERFTLFLMAVFAGVAFLLAVIGLSGVMSYTVAQRTREIGIRLAIGAQPSEVLFMILQHAVLLVSAGIFGGIVGSIIVTTSLENLLFKVSPYDPLTFFVITFVFLVTAIISGYVPARKAAMIDPAITLRSD
jgi:predicted permease